MNITDGTQLSPAQLELLSINTIRFLSVDAVQKADSGHPGLPLGAAPMAYVLWTRFLQHNPANPHWFDRDRFVLSAGGNPPDIILMATGSEVSLILAVGQRLIQRQIKVRIVSLPSWELFETQPRSYRDGVLPPSVNTRLAVEAGTTQGWRMYVGEQGDVVGVDHFGASAPGHEIMCQNGFTVDDVFARALKLLNLEGVDSRLSQLI